MVWPILISVSVTPGAFSAAADIAIAPLSKLPNKIRNISHPALFENPATSARIQGADRKHATAPISRVNMRMIGSRAGPFIAYYCLIRREEAQARLSSSRHLLWRPQFVDNR